jgi:hypothetical protein
MPIRSFMLLPSRAEELYSPVDQPVFDSPSDGRQPPPLKTLPIQPLPLESNTHRIRALRVAGPLGEALEPDREFLLPDPLSRRVEAPAMRRIRNSAAT